MTVDENGNPDQMPNSKIVKNLHIFRETIINGNPKKNIVSSKSI